MTNDCIETGRYVRPESLSEATLRQAIVLIDDWAEECAEPTSSIALALYRLFTEVPEKAALDD